MLRYTILSDKRFAAAEMLRKSCERESFRVVETDGTLTDIYNKCLLFEPIAVVTKEERDKRELIGFFGSNEHYTDFLLIGEENRCFKEIDSHEFGNVIYLRGTHSAELNKTIRTLAFRRREQENCIGHIIECELEKRTWSILLELGFSPGLTGTLYLHEAVSTLCRNGEKKPQSFSKSVYPQTAEKYQVTAVSVEKCIRHALKDRWRNADDSERLKEYFGCGNGCQPPGNKKAILIIAGIVRHELDLRRKELRKQMIAEEKKKALNKAEESK